MEVHGLESQFELLVGDRVQVRRAEYEVCEFAVAFGDPEPCSFGELAELGAGRAEIAAGQSVGELVSVCADVDTVDLGRYVAHGRHEIVDLVDICLQHSSFPLCPVITL